MAQVNNIKDLYENEDLSLREISRQTGHSFKTVQKYAYQLDWSEDNLPDTEPTSYPVLGDFIPVIDEWLEADRKIPRKQRHTVWRIFCRLRDEHGFGGSYSSVKVRPQKAVRDEFQEQWLFASGAYAGQWASRFRKASLLRWCRAGAGRLCTNHFLPEFQQRVHPNFPLSEPGMPAYRYETYL